MNRKQTREYMMSVIFQLEANKDFGINKMDQYIKTIRPTKQREYGEKVYSLICNKKDAIDEEIIKFSRKWRLERMPKTDVAILRLAVLEILYMEDIPDSVSINEAVELAKIYCDEKSPSYINGILGSVSKEKDES